MKYDFKLGVSYAEERPLSAPLPLCGELGEAMRDARQAGFDGIELYGREYEFDRRGIERIKRLCEESGAEIAALASGRLYTQTGLSLAEPEAARRGWVLMQMKKYIAAAAELHMDLIIGWVRGRFAADNPPELYFRTLQESMKELDIYAGDRQVRLLMEVINRYETDSFRTTKETLEFLEENELENTLLHLDTFHMNIEEDSLCEAIRTAGARLGYFHAADNTRRCPGSGSLNFPEIAAELAAVGYHGFVTVECLPGSDGRETAKRAAGYFRDLMRSENTHSSR